MITAELRSARVIDIVRAEPGDCPICGMALEARAPVAGEDDDEHPELAYMRRRFWPSCTPPIPPRG